MTIDITKAYRTRDGREVRIYAVDGWGMNPVHGAVKDREDRWCLMTWPAHGQSKNKITSQFDLIEVSPRIKREYWVNVYRDGEVLHRSERNANLTPTPMRIACVHINIDCEEGEGL